MDGAKFAKMLSDKHLFELDRMEYKYSVSSVQEFTELLRQNFAQPLPLADFSSDELFYLPNLAQISTNGMKQLLSAPASNQTFGLQAMTEEIHATFQIESIHSSRNSIRHILNGYAPRNEEESCILLSPTIIPILMAMAARLGCSTFGILSSRAILRHCSRRFPAILLRARQPTTKPMTVSKRTHSSLATRT